MTWKSEMLGAKLEVKGGSISTEALVLADGDVLGLYFSAHWCPPCRGFTPQLVEFYNKINQKGGKKFHIVFVTADRSVDQFKEYFGEMPWHAIPFNDKETIGKLCDECGVRGIPKLVLYDCNGTLIKTKSDARTMVSADREGKEFPWAV